MKVSSICSSTQGREIVAEHRQILRENLRDQIRLDPRKRLREARLKRIHLRLRERGRRRRSGGNGEAVRGMERHRFERRVPSHRRVQGCRHRSRCAVRGRCGASAKMRELAQLKNRHPSRAVPDLHGMREGTREQTLEADRKSVV